MDGEKKIRSPKLFNKTTTSWMLYDIANSAYILMIPAVSYAVYYRSYVCGGGAQADAQWALLVSFALGCAGLLSPFIGAIADIGGLRHRLFVFTTIVCCFATAALFFVRHGDVILGAVLFFIAHLIYVLAISLYDSYLKEIVSQELSGRLSGISWGMGYIGGIMCLILCYPFLKGNLEPENLSFYRLAFVITALFYLIFSVPAFIFLPRKESRNVTKTLPLIRDSYLELWHTLRSWKQEKEVFKFLLAFYFISDAIVTIIFFTAIYLQSNFGLKVMQILGLTLLVQLIGIPATGLFGYMGDRWDKKKTILITIAIWIIIVLIMVFGTKPYIPILMSCLMGTVLGSTQALCRSLFTEIIPLQKTTEFFGFNTFAGKVSSIFGPLVFGAFTALGKSQRVGLASLLIFFIIGASILLTIHIPSSKLPKA